MDIQKKMAVLIEKYGTFDVKDSIEKIKLNLRYIDIQHVSFLILKEVGYSIEFGPHSGKWAAVVLDREALSVYVSNPEDYIKREFDFFDLDAALDFILKNTNQERAIELSLGIDKTTIPNDLADQMGIEKQVDESADTLMESVVDPIFNDIDTEQLNEDLHNTYYDTIVDLSCNYSRDMKKWDEFIRNGIGRSRLLTDKSLEEFWEGLPIREASDESDIEVFESNIKAIQAFVSSLG